MRKTITAEEIALEGTPEGEFLDTLTDLFCRLEALEKEHGRTEKTAAELFPAMDTLTMCIYNLAGEKWNGSPAKITPEATEAAANTFCEYLKKWIMQITTMNLLPF